MTHEPGGTAAHALADHRELLDVVLAVLFDVLPGARLVPERRDVLGTLRRDDDYYVWEHF